MSNVQALSGEHEGALVFLDQFWEPRHDVESKQLEEKPTKGMQQTDQVEVRDLV